MRAYSTPLLAVLLAAAVSPALAAPAPAPAHKAATPGAATAPAATPAATGITADVRCLMTMIAFGQDKARTQAAQVGVYFFYGRINERAPGFDLASAMKAEAPRMGPADLQTELARCGPMVAAASQKLQASVASLRPPGAPPAAPPPAAAPAPK